MTASKDDVNAIPYTFTSSSGLVTDLQAWVNNPSSNFGWLMMSENETSPYTARRIGSRDDSPRAAVLRVDYSVPTLGISQQPQSQTNFVGSTVSFTVAAAGVPPFSYQWFFESNPLIGATTDTLVLDNIQTNQSGLYFASVSNSSGSTNSQSATLSVLPLPPGLPVVKITSPTNNAKFPVGADILLSAEASESNGTITQVEFFLGTNSAAIVPGVGPSFSVVYSNAAAGTYLLHTEATDSSGEVGKSGSLPFTVIPPPTVSVTAPHSGDRFAIGNPVTLSAAVASGGGRIAQVEFFSAPINAAGVGSRTSIGVDTNSPYSVPWLPTARGDFILTAVATDDLGQSGQATGVVARVFVPELILPTIVITSSPPNFGVTGVSPIRLAGRASDNIAVDYVEYTVTSGPFLSLVSSPRRVPGGPRWEAFVPLAPGRNLVRIHATDQAGNKSTDVLRVFTYIAFGRLTIHVSGSGTVFPNLDGYLLQLGNVYQVQASPAPGNIFLGWDGVKPTNKASLTFEMKQDLEITANFIANPFIRLAGAYTGLFLDADTNRFRPECSGFLRVQMGAGGGFSGAATLQEGAYPFIGRFDPHGNAQVAIVRHGLPPVAFSLQVNLTNGSDTITGTATTGANGSSLSVPVLLQRNVFSLANPAPEAGHHVFALQRPEPDPPLTVITAAANITPSGGVTIQGVFRNSIVFVRGSAVAKDGSVPFYLSLGLGAEVLSGWLNFSGGDQAGSGQVFWVHGGRSGVTLLNQVGP
jgi:hypothetical protein